MIARSALLAAVLATSLSGPVSAGRLDLAFLPPDFPPTDVCRAPAEQVEADETRVSDDGEGYDSQEELKAWLSYLKRDMRRLQREDADRHFGFIEDLISLRAELDPEFSGADEAFARIDLHIDAGRIAEIEEKALVEALAARADDLSQTERVRLARYFMTGVGVAIDRARGERMLADEAFKGNANALLELLRLQLAGVELVEWFETPERTATLAFGGKIGQLNRGLCGRAEFIARAYIDGDLLVPNADLAFAWRKFAADQGGQAAAWRVVEHMLNAGVGAFSHDDVLHYLRLALDDEFLIEARDVEALHTAGATRAHQIADVLSRLHGPVGGVGERSAVPFFELSVSEDGGLNGDSHHLRYLRRITQFDDVPGVIWSLLADEVILQIGRWAGEDEARDALERAVAAGYAKANVRLAQMLLRESVESGEASRSLELLLDAVDVHGLAEAQRELDAFYRCTAPTAPMAVQAGHWTASEGASQAFSIGLDATDYVKLSRSIEPELLAHVQRLAMSGNSIASAGFLTVLETDPTVSDATLRYWADRVGRSQKALETYAVFRHRVATNAGDAAEAVDFMRRAQLSVGPSMALDLATVLVDHAGRAPGVAGEVRAHLESAAARGEGAAIRLLHRLSGGSDDKVYRTYADAIEARGDFLALTFAAQFVDGATLKDYMGRAVAEMRCGTKDVSEIAEAFAFHGDSDAVMHWMKVGLAISHGHSMSRLRIDPYRMDMFDTPLATEAKEDRLNDLEFLRREYHAVSVPLTDGFDRDAAAALLADALSSAREDVVAWAFEEYSVAELGIRRVVQRAFGVEEALFSGADVGVVSAQYAYGLHLRETARDSDGLVRSASWLKRAADAGHAGAMVDYAYGLAHGVGVPQDRKLALIWLRRAEALLEPRAAGMVALVEALQEQG